MTSQIHSFSWKNYVFLLKKDRNGELIYRDRDHLGGPWSSVDKTLQITSFDKSFRKTLAKAKEAYLQAK